MGSSELLPALIMPSLCTKPQENGATPPDTPLQAALAIVEKKVRNLEKRKGKLDAYRDTLQRGKSLNEDQQAAVAKYDEVIGTLEFARELSGQFTKLALDEAKDNRWGGDKGRGRGRGGGGRGFGRGNRGYSRGRGDRGGDRGHRGGDRGRNDRKYDDRREDRRD